MDGKPLCKCHRDEELFQRLDAHFSNWKGNDVPPERFRYYLGRLESDFVTKGDSYVSTARIRDRGFNWCKEEDGCTFEITRHPGAWSKDGPIRRVVQQWRVNLGDRVFQLMGERDFQDGDYDR